MREQKLRQAAQQLRETNLTVMNIALNFGFETQQGFTRRFSRVYKLPPGAYL
ncbi:helix-turn-helix domain-containing protein [Erwinia sp.]|uniref:helix-turn-helix domain-containing protein n=1 Tax=Erwinia citreus TaxID=558 RepID=UPI003C74451E